MNQRKYLALDVGSKTVGLATSNGFVAKPKGTLRFNENDFKKPQQDIITLCQTEHYTDLVIGYPINMNNTIGPQAKKIDHFVSQLKRNEFIKTHVEFHLIDERLTTRLAQQYLRTANIGYKKRKAKKDSLAAQIILNTFLQKQAK